MLSVSKINVVIYLPNNWSIVRISITVLDHQIIEVVSVHYIFDNSYFVNYIKFIHNHTYLVFHIVFP